MEFSDFLLEEEELDFLSEAIVDEGLWDVAAGLGRSVGGAMGVGDELIARAMGQGKKGELRRSLGDIGGGFHRAVFGKPSAKPTEQTPAPTQARTATPEEIKAVRDEFERLKVAYKQAEKMGDRDLMRRVRARMLRVDPAAYTDLMNRSIEARKRRERQRWSFLDDVPMPTKSHDYLNSLGTKDEPGQAGPEKKPS